MLETLSRHGPAAVDYALPFVLILALALNGGGYDSIVRGWGGVAIWWTVLLGCLLGVLPAVAPTRRGMIAFALLVGVVAWTVLGMIWSESVERTVVEVGRALFYLGVFTFTFNTQGRDSLRRTVTSVAAAIGLIGLLALLSRLQPQWFPDNETAQVLLDSRGRLNYPLDYWNGLAALLAIGTPLIVWLASSANRRLVRGAAAAALPALLLAAFYTLSRGGAVEMAVAIAVLLAIHPRRIAVLIPTLAITGGGGALAIFLASRRDQLADGVISETARTQGDEMLAIIVVICVVVGLLQVAIAGGRHRLRLPRPTVSGRAGRAILLGGACATVAVLIAAGAPAEISDQWNEFKEPVAASNEDLGRLSSSSSNGRYQLWQSALDAAAANPVTGTGAGTFEFWWAREATIPGFIRDAHSLYFETLGEQGIVGLLLVGGLIVFVIATAVGGARRAGPGGGELFAAVAAACAAFATAAAVDWVWELAVVPVSFLILAAALFAARPAGDAPGPTTGSDPSRSSSLALAVTAVAALIAIAVPLAGTLYLSESQASVNAGRPADALSRARTAGDLQWWAAAPRIQEALVLELTGDFEAAAAAAQTATEKEPTNWRNWLVLSRLEARAGDAEESIAAYQRARSLNPMSQIFQISSE